MSNSRRQVYRRRRFAFFGVLAVILAFGAYLTSTGLAPVSSTAATLTEPPALSQAAVEPTWPGQGAGAIGAVGFDGVLGSTGDQASMPIASITKMVTALVILQAKPLTGDEPGPDITFTDDDVDIYYDAIAENGSVAPVSAGQVLSQREAFETMLIPSANNYSVSLAVWAFGSVDAYLVAAADYLAANGLTGTVVADTSGISAQSVSSPADLVAIGKLVMADPALASIVAMPSAVIPTVGTVTNTNKLLGVDGVDGIKTGTTDEAGACLLFAVDVPVGDTSVTLVGVVLGGDTHSELNESILSLIESVSPGFRTVTLVEAGTPFGTYTTPWGQSAQAVAETSESAVVWSDTPIESTVDVAPVTLGEKGDSVGSVDVTVGTNTVSVPLVLDQTITDPGPFWRWTNPGEI
ncbi:MULTISPECIES: D-alanyl-D-alanine carboxypeptidase family protein [unclassified Cryobacterium]|uniref:D-alanyl-D-alanine carboxypeptidase family protein n=1 Tax=unclassified Cryobacterium TaxID=2649013 RepID=UPI0010696EF4|nr:MULTISPECIES: D-alanyl-D-alanine carboxypeptidase [unclassified Cryobacterium]TFC55686.1 D-alanyl-D-alanine carboxypeptidase [Cryobacterium sp. TMB3-1-2]TFC72758.1 D-alanyl-D-alanine carboxypeptidase [Cryobacterium sp. TMB3-15]TFC76264.1 D-alanyl-D-alanine carboxypeptidase [Cryobacterium sp. TMB3-10]TFC87253.1 D-alanyl-D-alanine carboxypeptidase [Cryobacterium sp. TMT4-31]TFD43479.1 D-alanyl-D-alanine carboxypeptidase [Cryobacterium sp. TMB3-12]